MATCIRCGSDLLPSETQCGRCGAAHAGPHRPAPLGVWASERPPSGAAAPMGGGAKEGSAARERTPVPGRQFAPVPQHRQRRGGSGASPMPAAAAQLLPATESVESTGTHPTEQIDPPGADVVPLRPTDATPQPGGDGFPPGSDPEAGRSGMRPTTPGAVPEGPKTDKAPATPPPRPPVLASESLREDIEPTEPWRRALRLVGTSLSVAGAVACVALGGAHLGVFVVALLLLAAGVTCLAPLSYAVRAWTVLMLSGTALALATAMRAMAGAPAEAAVLAPAAVVLAAGLMFRSAYRASHLARTVVAAGMLAIAVALVLADAVGEFAQVGTSWQGWLHVGAAIGFGILLLVSLLAFMAASTTGGTMLWAVCLLVWYAINVTFTVVRHAYPEPGGPQAITLPDPMAGLSAAAAAAVALAAIALAQSLAIFVGGTAEQRRRRSRR
jgi:hypothetical protein